MLQLATKLEKYSEENPDEKIMEKLKNNFEIIQVALGKLEELLMDKEAPLITQQEQLQHINNLFNNFQVEGVDVSQLNFRLSVNGKSQFNLKKFLRNFKHFEEIVIKWNWKWNIK